jgi:hypothetical protein
MMTQRSSFAYDVGGAGDVNLATTVCYLGDHHWSKRSASPEGPDPVSP